MTPCSTCQIPASGVPNAFNTKCDLCANILPPGFAVVHDDAWRGSLVHCIDSHACTARRQRCQPALVEEQSPKTSTATLHAFTTFLLAFLCCVDLNADQRRTLLIEMECRYFNGGLPANGAPAPERERRVQP
jgi:hypothetical protein